MRRKIRKCLLVLGSFTSLLVVYVSWKTLLQSFTHDVIDSSAFSSELSKQHNLRVLNNSTRYQYHLPKNPLVTGKEFVFNNSTSRMAKHILRTQTFKNKPVQMKSVESLPNVVPVTAISSNHFDESFFHTATIPVFFPGVKLVLYDLGLEEAQVKKLLERPFVDYRKFNFSNYPPYVKDLYTYAWKVFIIQETLAEFGAIFWMDAAITVADKVLFRLQHMVKEKSGFLFEYGHGNLMYKSIHSDMLKYLPVKSKDVTRHQVMQMATAMLIINTEEVQRDVMQWAILCSLCRGCIAPLGSKINCKNSVPDVNQVCHKYDQSMFSILVQNVYNFQLQKYYPAGSRITLGRTYDEKNVEHGNKERFDINSQLLWEQAAKANELNKAQC